MKKMFLFAATAAIALSSCSKNEVMEVATPNDNPYTIGLGTGMFTTKGAAMTTTILEGTTVNVLIDSDAKADITPSFTSSAAGVWDNSTHAWSEVDYPASLYSLQDEDGAVGTLAYTAAGSITPVSYSVTDADVTTHKDLIYFGEEIYAQPNDNKIAAVYKHALSRAYISVTHTGCNVYIASARLVNMSATGDFSFTDASVPTWDNVTGIAGAYNYFKYADDATNGVVEATQTSALSNVATHDMYLIPQTTVATAAAPKVDQATETFIEFIYRVEDGGKSIVGFKDVADVESFDSKAKVTVTSPADATNGIFVKAYVAVNAAQLATGSYYNLAVDLTAKSVIYAADQYFDRDGNPIVIASDIITEPEVDDPVNPDAAEYIGLRVVEIENWPTTPENL